MARIIELNAKQFADRLRELKLDESLDFAIDNDHSTEDVAEMTESNLESWYGAKRLFLFDNDFIVVSHYGYGYSGTVSQGDSAENNDYFNEDVESMLECIGTETVYIVEKQEVEQ
ncbi:hypothetical protein AGMMS49975_16680 [Clostridia bacterium]|nr:hypothetical protein AGMMS49975_16680 [Clostridia bacterium]